MFEYADEFATDPRSVFYVAADRCQWQHDPKSGWALSEIYGAFRNVDSFIIQLLIPAPNQCFYEIIHANSPCKAYFDLEVWWGGARSRARLCFVPNGYRRMGTPSASTLHRAAKGVTETVKQHE
jgi:hypothetical protein